MGGWCICEVLIERWEDTVDLSQPPTPPGPAGNIAASTHLYTRVWAKCPAARITVRKPFLESMFFCFK